MDPDIRHLLVNRLRTHGDEVPKLRNAEKPATRPRSSTEGDLMALLPKSKSIEALEQMDSMSIAREESGSRIKLTRMRMPTSEEVEASPSSDLGILARKEVDSISAEPPGSTGGTQELDALLDFLESDMEVSISILSSKIYN
jgi:hypothetical protein